MKKKHANEKRDRGLFKKKYVSPKLECTLLEMENSIAAGSAQVKPLPGNVKEEWETEEQTGNLDW
ncbi:hypothetical protein [Elizabethkingia meningoseptica]|uniref:hypothetical protein n=1 Tax=Elizabethkingia meningoseptica TaxID=238 RepID=UPI003891AA17